jgi:hypothetical protein
VFLSLSVSPFYHDFSAIFKTAHIANFNYSTQDQSPVVFVLVLVMMLSFSIQNFFG